MINKQEPGVIVVPWDFSPLCRAGLNQSLQLSNSQKKIHVVHVATPLSGPDSGALYATAEKQKCQDLESRFRDQVADDPTLNEVRFHVVYGYFGAEIARFADRYQAELIVVPTRIKRTFLDKFFGGLANQVVKQAQRPVHVVQVDESTLSLTSHPSKIYKTLTRFWKRNAVASRAR